MHILSYYLMLLKQLIASKRCSICYCANKLLAWCIPNCGVVYLNLSSVDDDWQWSWCEMTITLPCCLKQTPTVWVKKNPLPWGHVAIFPKRLGILTKFYMPITHSYLRIFIQISASLTKLYHIKRDHPVKIMCAKCPPSAKTHFLTFFPNSLEFLV